MSDIKITIGADITQLQTELAKAGGVTQDFANKSAAASSKVGTGFTAIANKSQIASSALSSMGQAAGGAAGELSSLGSTLLTGGILAAIPLIVIGLQELGDKLFGLTAEQKAYNETLQNTVSDFAKANTQVAEMAQKVELAKNGFASKDQVVKEFNNTIGKTIGFAKDLNEAEALLIAKGPAYIQMMTLKSAATFALAKSGQLLAESIMLQIENSSSSNTSTSNAALKRLSGKIKEQSDIYRDLAAEFNKAAIKIATDAGLNVVDVEKPVKDAKEKITHHVRDINDVLKDMNTQLKYLEFREINLKTDEAKGKIAALESALAEIVKKFGKGAKNPIVIDLIARINVIKFEEKQEGIGHSDSLAQKIEKHYGHTDVDLPVSVHLQLDVADKELQKFQDTVRSIVGSAIESVSDALGKLIAGGASVGDFFSTLFQTLGAGLKQLGKYFIQTALEIIVFKKLITKNPYLALAAGVTLVILGSVIENATAKKSAFASGVRSFSGGSALVGERGPERLFLPAGSSVQPNNELNAFGGSGITLQPSIEYSGAGFRIMLNRVDAQFGRNN